GGVAVASGRAHRDTGRAGIPFFLGRWNQDHIRPAALLEFRYGPTLGTDGPSPPTELSRTDTKLGETPMKWVTRERVKVDRVACPWLIRKFIDPTAEFLFVPAETMIDTARREGAVPFDVPGVEFGHHGQECSFDALVKKHQFDRDPAMVLLAKIVNGA